MSRRHLLAAVTLDDLLDALTDRIAERIAPRVGASSDGVSDPWLRTREAAQHLGMHPDNVRKLAAAGVIPCEQDAPRCARYFRLSELDRWREAGSVRRVVQDASTRLPRARKAR